MAQKVSIILVDDIDESEATETVEFALDGQKMEIDLNDEHAAELRKALAPYMSAGFLIGKNGKRRKKPSPGRTRKQKSAVTKQAVKMTAAEVRVLAKQRNIPVAKTGRIGKAKLQEVLDAPDLGIRLVESTKVG